LIASQVLFGTNVQYYYLARAQGGEFGTGDGEELTGRLDPAVGTYTPVWVNVHEIEEKLVKPTAVAELVVVSQKLGWPVAVQYYEEGT